jgi:hypothetical protein
MLNMQNAEAESLTGVKAFTSGISGQSLGATATGIRSALDATSKRELGILRRLAEGIKQIGRKVISMNAEFLEEEEVVRITNEEFVTVRKDDLAGNFDLKLTVSTAEADNQKAEELSFMLQTMGNGMDVSMSQMILADIAKLRKMPTLAKKIEQYQPQPDPIAQKKAELEVALLEAQVQREQSMAYENTANANLYKARLLTEQAKAKHLNSDADLKDLEFLETESGTTQERKLQAIDNQSKGNIALKAAESTLGRQDAAITEQPATVAQPGLASV